MYISKLVFSILLILFASSIYPNVNSSNYLSIPAIGLHEAIVIGYTTSIMKDGLLLSPRSLKENNWIIYGHRFLSSQPLRKFFNGLNNIQIGNEIELSYNNKRYTYKVVNILTVSPKDLWVLSSKYNRQLTLITCTPLLNPVNRLVVISNLVSEQ